MKRAVAFLFVALFILLVVEPNFVGNQAARKDKIPVYVDGSALKTNNDVETKQATSQATEAMLVIVPKIKFRKKIY